ncbi:hypothetical protein JAAARDRAFT_70207 [Jaapia argillacea MUCL 33604]|uniref:DUF6534 domain-containing protein n=1 Tax=Jaapia argillacea MUCL 33604 TaxID=933084 RepID=A0A067Q198_9AGAM|nr:hypothetical protein JAAARDRAFT_70207 [Jaapia argillacea MUCL 33604]
MVSLTWDEKISSMVTMWMACPVQSFWIWRCWVLTGKSWFTMVPLVSLLLGTVATSIFITDVTLALNFTSFNSHPGPSPALSVFSPYVINVAFGAVLDLSVTSILLVVLLRSRRNIFTRRFRRTFRRLVIISWEAGVPPCVCAVATLAIYLISRNQSFWNLFTQAILGKFYVMSLFITLNGRADLRTMGCPSLPPPAPHDIPENQPAADFPHHSENGQDPHMAPFQHEQVTTNPRNPQIPGSVTLQISIVGR